jgi:hypothetical protein
LININNLPFKKNQDKLNKISFYTIKEGGEIIFCRAFEIADIKLCFGIFCHPFVSLRTAPER